MKFVKNYEKPLSSSLVSIKASIDARELERHLSNSLMSGSTLIVESVGENISYLFDDLLSGNFTYTGTQKTVTVGA